jgi:hypothetical protein
MFSVGRVTVSLLKSEYLSIAYSPFLSHYYTRKTVLLKGTSHLLLCLLSEIRDREKGDRQLFVSGKRGQATFWDKK